MGNKTSKRWRQTAVWLHVITSVGWMGQALALFTLLVVSYTSDDAAVRVSATSMAHTLDTNLLAPLANASAFTGFMLAAATSWGFFRHWWVLAKFSITVVQLYLGIFILSDGLQASVDAAAAGLPQPAPLPQIVGTALMAGAIAYQGWLSMAKPWQRTPWAAGSAKLPTAPTWIFVMITAVTVLTLALGVVMGELFPAPAVVALAGFLVFRRRILGTARAAREPAVIAAG